MYMRTDGEELCISLCVEIFPHLQFKWQGEKIKAVSTSSADTLRKEVGSGSAALL